MLTSPYLLRCKKKKEKKLLEKTQKQKLNSTYKTEKIKIKIKIVKKISKKLLTRTLRYPLT